MLPGSTAGFGGASVPVVFGGFAALWLSVSARLSVSRRVSTFGSGLSFGGAVSARPVSVCPLSGSPLSVSAPVPLCLRREPVSAVSLSAVSARPLSSAGRFLDRAGGAVGLSAIGSASAPRSSPLCPRARAWRRGRRRPARRPAAPASSRALLVAPCASPLPGMSGSFGIGHLLPTSASSLTRAGSPPRGDTIWTWEESSPLRRAWRTKPGGLPPSFTVSAMKSGRAWRKVLGAARTGTPARVEAAIRCRWPPTIARTCGWGPITAARASRSDARHVDAVPVGDRGRQRRVVHGDDRRLVGSRGELGLQPLELGGLEVAVVLAGDGRVDDDEAERAEVDRVVDRLTALAADPERLPHRRPVVVVAGQDVDRHPEPADHLLRERVLLRRRVLGDVPGDEDRIRPVRQPLERLHHGLQAGLRLVPGLLRLADVRVAQLREEEGPRQGADPRWSARAGGGGGTDGCRRGPPDEPPPLGVVAHRPAELRGFGRSAGEDRGAPGSDGRREKLRRRVTSGRSDPRGVRYVS